MNPNREYLKKEEIISNTPTIKRELIEIDRYNEISPAMLDTPGRRQEYSSIVIVFPNDNTKSFKVIKNRYGDTGIFLHQSIVENILKREKQKTDMLYVEIDDLKSKINMLSQRPRWMKVMDWLLK